MKKINPYFDPDEILLNKEIIRKIINAIIKRWKQNEKSNFWGIKALETFRISLRFYSDFEINSIFKSIIVCVNEMQMLNAMARMKNEFPTTVSLSNIIIAKLEKGELFRD